MKTEAQLDHMHDAVVARFPGGLNQLQFRVVTLESADDEDNGRVYPHSLAQPLVAYGWLVRMFLEGLLLHWDDGSGRPHMHQPSRWRITEKGRAWLVENRSAFENTEDRP